MYRTVFNFQGPKVFTSDLLKASPIEVFYWTTNETYRRNYNNQNHMFNKTIDITTINLIHSTDIEKCSFFICLVISWCPT